MHVVMAVQMSDNPFLLFTFDWIVGLGSHIRSLADKFSFFHLMSRNGQVVASQFASSGQKVRRVKRLRWPLSDSTLRVLWNHHLGFP